MPPRMTTRQSLVHDAGTGPRVVVRVSGEVDFDNVDAFTAALERAFAVAAVREVVVDLDTVTYLDSAGVAALMALRRRATALTVVNARGIARRVLELSGALATLTPPHPHAGRGDPPS